MIAARWIGLFMAMVAATGAQAAPSCPRPAFANESIVPVNGFAQNSWPQAIRTNYARCAWGIGLAIPRQGTGTAFIIGNRREVMTNLHVVDRDCTGNRRFTFSHGFRDGRALSRENATVVVTGDYCTKLRRRGRHDYSGDWAIAVLDADPASIEGAAPNIDTRPLEPRLTRGWLRDNGHYFLLGYGMSFRAGMEPYRSAPCRLGRLFSDGAVEHSCDASRRGSGAPIVSEDRDGNCLVAGIHVGEIVASRGRPPFIDDVNANVAVLSRKFAGAVAAVSRELDEGRSANQIAADLAATPPR